MSLFCFKRTVLVWSRGRNKRAGYEKTRKSTMTGKNIQELIGLMQKNLECSICLELLSNPVSTKCDHCFCNFCITQFLENKRSVPCPLCKQPVTKRSLQKREELENVVDAVQKLIISFQDDTGIIYSPPKGQPSYFPCTPDTAISTPVVPKSKPRKNLRSTKQPKNTSNEDLLNLFTEEKDTVLETSATRKKVSSRRKSAPSSESISSTSRTDSLRSRNKTRSGSTTTAQFTAGLLQYISEGSCGYSSQAAPHNGKNVKQVPSSQTQNQSQVSIFIDDLVDKLPKDASSEGKDHNVSIPSISPKQKSKQADKENLVENVSTQLLRKKESPAKSGLGDGSQNSSNISISTTQQFLQPRPVVTRTYGRHANKSSADLKVKNWIASLPANPPVPTSDIDQGPGVEGEPNLPLRWADEIVPNVDEIQEQNEHSPGTGEEKTVEKEKTAEIMLTPPVRKRRIFKSREPMEEQDKSKLPDESTDPYLFHVGHTPVPKSKRRGHSRLKENKGRAVPKLQLSLTTAGKKDVRFSADVGDTQEKPTADKREKKTGDRTAEVLFTSTGDASTVEQPLNDVFIEVTAAATSSDARNQVQQKHAPLTRSKRRTHKDTSGNEKRQGEPEKWTKELAAWIDQAEDHVLLFSTQEAHASIDSAEVEEQNAYGNIHHVIDVGEESDDYPNEDDDKCLVRKFAPEQVAESHMEFEVDKDPLTSKGTVSETEPLEKYIGKTKAVPINNQISSPAHSAVRMDDFRSPTIVNSKTSVMLDKVAETQLSDLQSAHDLTLPSPEGTMAFPSSSTPRQPIMRETRSSKFQRMSHGVNKPNISGTGGSPCEVMRASLRNLKNRSLSHTLFSERQDSPEQEVGSLGQPQNLQKKRDCHQNSGSASDKEGKALPEKLGRRENSDNLEIQSKKESKTAIPPATSVHEASPQEVLLQDQHESTLAAEELEADPAAVRTETVVEESSVPASCIPDTASPLPVSGPGSGTSSTSPQRPALPKRMMGAVSVSIQQQHANLPAVHHTDQEEKRKESSNKVQGCQANPEYSRDEGRLLPEDTTLLLPGSVSTHGDAEAGEASVNASLDIVAPTLENEEDDHDFEKDSCSSATDDLNITPALTDFEAPDLSLQPEEIQHHLSPLETKIASASISQQSSAAYTIKDTKPEEREAGLSEGKKSRNEEGREKNGSGDDDTKFVHNLQMSKEESLAKDVTSSILSLRIPETLSGGTLTGDSSITQAPESVDVASSENDPPSSAKLVSKRRRQHIKHSVEAYELAVPSPVISPPNSFTDRLASLLNNGQTMSRSSSSCGSPSQSLLLPFPARKESIQDAGSEQNHFEENTVGRSTKKVEMGEVSVEASATIEGLTDGLKPGVKVFLTEAESLPLFEQLEDNGMEGGFIHEEEENEEECKGLNVLVADTQFPSQNKNEGSPTLHASSQVVTDSAPALSGTSQDGKRLSEDIQCKIHTASRHDGISPRRQKASADEKSTPLASPQSSKRKSVVPSGVTEKSGHEQAVDKNSLEPVSAQMMSDNSLKRVVSPSLSQKSRKRKSEEEAENRVEKSLRLLPLQTPVLKSVASPASSSGKTVCSAPPCVPCMGSDSENEESVLIVRRSKRKCFSLSGSPLKSRTPAKRPRSRQHTRVEEEKHCRLPSVSGMVRENPAGYGDDVSASCAEDVTDKGLEQNVEMYHDVISHASHQPKTDQEDPGQLDLQKEDENSNCKDGDLQPVETPLRKGRKTRRGLASATGRAILLSSGVSMEGSAESAPVTHTSSHTDSKEKGGAEVELCQHTSSDGEREQGNQDTLGSNTGHLNEGGIQSSSHSLADTEDVLAVSISPTHSRALSQEKPLSQSQAVFQSILRSQTRPTSQRKPDLQETTSQQKLPIQTSLISQDKSLEITHVCLRTETEDATLPPTDFDLRFDSEEEEDCDSRGPQEKAEAVPCVTSSKAGDQLEGGRHSSVPLACPSPAAEKFNTDVVSLEELEAADDSDEEAVVVRKKRNKRPVIDSDTEPSHSSDEESDSSFQLNFTSSSAVSSQSEAFTTQQQNAMEAEIVQMREKIAQMEAALQQCSSNSKSDSSCDGSNTRNSNRGRSKTVVNAGAEHQSLLPARVAETDSSSAPKKSSRRKVRPLLSESDSDENQREGVDEDNDAGNTDAKSKQKADMAKQNQDDDICVSFPARQGCHSSPVCTPKKQTEDGMASDDSDDLFLSPLSPSPPPGVKPTLVRREPDWDPYFPLIDLVSVGTPVANPLAKLRLSLDFKAGNLKSGENAHSSRTSHPEFTKYDDIEDSQTSEADCLNLSGLKKIPESQHVDESSDVPARSGDQRRDREKHSKSPGSQLSGSPGSVCVVESSGSAPAVSVRSAGKNIDESHAAVDDNADDGASEDETGRWRRKRMGFVSSGLDQKKSEVLRKLAEEMDCKVYSKFNEQVTHVIMKTEPGSRVCERTLKYFQGVAGRCWVLSYDWVTESAEAGCILPEADYEVEGDNVKGDKHKGPLAARLDSSPLLQGFAFVCIGVSPDMSKKEVSQLVTMSGAELVEDPWDLNGHSAKHKLVLRCVDSDTQPPTLAEIDLYNGQYKHFGLVTVAREWLLDSICTHTRQPLAGYTHNTNKDLHLPF